MSAPDATQLLLIEKAIHKYYNYGKPNYVIGTIKEEITAENGEVITPYNSYYSIAIKRDLLENKYYLSIDNKRCSIYDIFKTSLITEEE